MIKQLAQALFNSKHAIVISGAGLSTDSGLPDFRSQNNGLYNKIDPNLLTITCLYQKPRVFYKNFRVFADAVKDKKPNAGHYAIAKLQELGIIQSILTQNIDNLHQLAGSKNVVEAHGHLRTCHCLQCGKEYDYRVLDDFLQQDNYFPLSQCCQKLLSPGEVVLFGGEMPYEFYSYLANTKADFALILGTSLQVYPVANIVNAVDSFAIINQESTPADNRAAIVINAPLSETLADIVREVESCSGRMV